MDRVRDKLTGLMNASLEVGATNVRLAVGAADEEIETSIALAVMVAGNTMDGVINLAPIGEKDSAEHQSSQIAGVARTRILAEKWGEELVLLTHEIGKASDEESRRERIARIGEIGKQMEFALTLDEDSPTRRIRRWTGDPIRTPEALSEVVRLSGENLSPDQVSVTIVTGLSRGKEPLGEYVKRLTEVTDDLVFIYVTDAQAMRLAAELAKDRLGFATEEEEEEEEGTLETMPSPSKWRH